MPSMDGVLYGHVNFHQIIIQIKGRKSECGLSNSLVFRALISKEVDDYIAPTIIPNESEVSTVHTLFDFVIK